MRISLGLTLVGRSVDGGGGGAPAGITCVDGGSVIAHDLGAGQLTATVANVTVPQGGSVFACISAERFEGSVVSVTWNGQALTQDHHFTNDNGSNGGVGALYSRHNNTGATGSLVVTMQNSTTAPITVGCLVATGLAAASTLDKVVRANGTSTTPSSGATATTAQADELLIGMVAYPDENNTARGGTWNNSFIGVHELTDAPGYVPGPYNAHLSTAYRIVSAAAAYTASKTGVAASANQGWIAIIGTYKKAP